jgi:hypothetical protein
MKFIVPNYSCLQNPWLGGYRPQIPVLSVLCTQLNLLNPPEKNSWLRHWVLSLHFIHDTPKYTEFPWKWYTVIHVQLSHRNYYAHNTLLTKLSHVNEHLARDSGMTAHHVRPTPMSPQNGEQHTRVIMNQCICNCTGIWITLSLKNTSAYLSTEEFSRSKK